MAQAALRLRRAVAFSPSLMRGPRSFSSVSASRSLSTVLYSSTASPASFANSSLRPDYPFAQRRFFRSSMALGSSHPGGGMDSKISPDEILFEGCDYNHWLITMDFPKDPAPTREEMIETYIQTLAKVVGSVEEAKKRMYALSTTTYHGFQAVMTEEMSEKFRGLPGVVFILPDSYIDPVNKEYGGDKYENGVITPRPPPIQYGTQGRLRNQNRSERPNYNRPPPHGNPPSGQQGSFQGDGWNRAPQQSYNPSGQYGRGYDTPGTGNFAPRNDFGQGEHQNYARSAVREGNQGGFRGATPPYQRNFGGGDRANYAPSEQRNSIRGPGGPGGENTHRSSSDYGFNQEYRQGGVPGNHLDYRQGVNPGYGGENKRGAGFDGDYKQGSASAYEQDYPASNQQGSWQERQ
ncbi:multiple organellar RNA editing factor 1, mitochondrial-like [Zingiber officinale]|uniref:MORF/ORRM1/DAG-like MORF domain-containing protein n=1 Tax=Zingiber officinale TaxID=94328 RepID=A0A8J5I5J0_ZINOF|nr:multiple organellar RNA editing factor 1, mitochondrial-like [Zingiber officinale]KAG6529192.1 hypothetical protein ZIOFF_011388 [Zingiber officinale]